MNFLIRLIGVFSVISFFEKAQVTMPAKAEKGVTTVGVWARDEIRRLAPKDTGHYASTIDIAGVERRASGVVLVIGTAEPYGARLELGYNQPDRLGRRFSQAPRPHFGPVADQVGGRLLTHMNQVFS